MLFGVIPKYLIRIGFAVRGDGALYEVRDPSIAVIHGYVAPEMLFAVFNHYDVTLLRAVVTLVNLLKIVERQNVLVSPRWINANRAST